MVRYMVVIERGETSRGAYVPDLPGCIAVGETREEALRLIREASSFTSTVCAADTDVGHTWLAAPTRVT